jgi:hypothetical protein
MNGYSKRYPDVHDWQQRVRIVSPRVQTELFQMMGRLFSNVRLHVVRFLSWRLSTENSFSKLISQSVRRPHIMLSRGTTPWIIEYFVLSASPVRHPCFIFSNRCTFHYDFDDGAQD